MKTEYTSPTATITCERCGYQFQLSLKTIERRGASELCADCNRKPTKIVTNNGLTCYPWQGEFDLERNVAIYNGKPHMVGPRTCGNADCMNRNHIIEIIKAAEKKSYPKPKPPRKFRPGMGILGGQVITYNELLKDIEGKKS